ncbi:hypothetical protein [Reyranella sp.]|jgi:hypothetical protein|uniref:hypothetical protein n=1 Tax=Reyranella sp. TaxID=1929291 RepID=UPI002F927D2D
MAIPQVTREVKQKESGRRAILAAGFALWAGPAHAQSGLDAGGLTFRDFAIADRGASFNRTDSMLPDSPGPARARVLEIDNAKGLARLHFDTVKIDLAVPLGWQAIEDQERGVAYNADKSYRLIVWRLDFTFEGVNDAEQYATTKVGTIEARRPPTKAQARRLGDGSYLVIYENVPPSRGDTEPRTVFDLVTVNPSNPKGGALMTLGVPASQGRRGLNLLALLNQNIHYSW